MMATEFFAAPVDQQPTDSAQPDTGQEFVANPIRDESQSITPGIDTNEFLTGFSKRVVGSGVQTAVPLAGTLAGGAVGAEATPGSIVGPLTGAGLGAAAGLQATPVIMQQLEDLGLAVSDIRDLPPSQRVGGVVGEVFGGAFPFATAPLIIGRFASLGISNVFGGSGVQRFIEISKENSFIQRNLDRLANFAGGTLAAASKSPGRFLAQESSSAGSAALAGGVAQTVSPDSPGVRAIAETVGGLFSIPALTTKAVLGTGRVLVKTAKRFTTRGRQNEVSDIILQAFQQSGENPETFLESLGAVKLPAALEDQTLTAGQVTGSPTITAIEKELAAVNPDFAGKLKQSTVRAFNSIETVIKLFRAEGSPEALQAVAEIRGQQFKLFLAQHVKAAQEKIVKAGENISTDNRESIMAYSKQAREIVEDTINRVKPIEDALYAEVGDFQLPGDTFEDIFTALDRVKGRFLVREQTAEFLPRAIRETLDDITKARALQKTVLEGGEISAEDAKFVADNLSTKQLVLLRRRLTKLSSEAIRGANPDFATASVLGELAEGASQALEVAGLKFPGSALTNANRFHAEFKSVFSEGFVGEMGHIRTTGETKVPFNTTLLEAFSAGPEAVNANMAQLERTTRFLPEQGFGDIRDEVQFELMLRAQERIIRFFGAEFLKRDPVTNVVVGLDKTGAAKFLRDHVVLLKRFPEVQASIQNAIKDVTSAEALLARAKQNRTFFDKSSIINKITGAESTTAVFQGIMSSQSPQAAFKTLANLTKKNGPDAVQGLRATIFKGAFASATDSAGNVSVPKLILELSKDIKPGLPSILDLAKQEGIIAPEDFNQLKLLVARTLTLFKSELARPTGAVNLEDTDLLADFFARVAGSGLARTVAQNTGLMRSGDAGQSLIIARSGSSILRKMLEKKTKLSVRQVLIDALSGAKITPDAESYSLLKTLMERGLTPVEKTLALRRVHAYAVQAGYFSLDSIKIPGEASPPTLSDREAAFKNTGSSSPTFIR